MDGMDGSSNAHVVVYVVVYLMRGSDVLLIRRRPDARVVPDRFMGVGGHLELGEDPFIGAARECREESGLTPLDLRLRGTLVWTENIHHKHAGLLYVFTATIFEGKLLEESDEGALHWMPIAALDTLEAFVGRDRRCIPHLLRDPTAHVVEIEQREGEGSRIINSNAYFAERARR